MEYRVKTDATTEPIAVSEVKNYLKLSATVDAEDDLIESMMKAARQLCEEYTNLSFAEKTIELLADHEETEEPIALPYVPTISVTSVVKIDQEGNETAMTLNTDYYVEGLIKYDVVINRQFQTMISTGYKYKITYTAGYTTLPEAIKIAIYKQIKDWYLNRDNWIPQLSSSVKIILDEYSANVWL